MISRDARSRPIERGKDRARIETGEEGGKRRSFTASGRFPRREEEASYDFYGTRVVPLDDD